MSYAPPPPPPEGGPTHGAHPSFHPHPRSHHPYPDSFAYEHRSPLWAWGKYRHHWSSHPWAHQWHRGHVHRLRHGSSRLLWFIFGAGAATWYISHKERRKEGLYRDGNGNSHGNGDPPRHLCGRWDKKARVTNSEGNVNNPSSTIVSASTNAATIGPEHNENAGAGFMPWGGSEKQAEWEGQLTSFAERRLEGMAKQMEGLRQMLAERRASQQSFPKPNTPSQKLNESPVAMDRI